MGLLVGLTGTMGCGKSTSAAMLKEMGAFIIDADVICRDLVHPNRFAWKEIIQAFGNEILHADQETIDRGKLAEIIFNDSEKKEQLEKILHPKVIAEEMNLADKFFTDHPGAIVVVEAALLIESGNHQKMDKVVVVTCDEEQSIQRAMRRCSLSREEVASRIHKQMPQSQKIEKAHYVLNNNGSPEEFKTKVQALYLELKALT